MPNAVFFADDPKQIERVFAEGRRERLQAELDFFPEMISTANFAGLLPAIQGVEYAFATWGMPQLNEEQINQLPALKAVFYAAGSVQYFARPFLNKGVTVVSAWAANAVPVAQVTVAQITLAAKGYFRAERLCRTSPGRNSFENHHPGTFGTTIALLGAGMIGSKVIELLKPYELDILVYDPFLTAERAAALAVRRVSLEEAFERGVVVSNHIADLPETRGLLRRDLFARMPPYATFINTGRGATLDEAGMLEVMAGREDLTALLDVTFPEPPLPDSLIYRLENVLLSPHIAGNISREVLRQADCVIEEFERFKNGEALKYAVSLEMLQRMA